MSILGCSSSKRVAMVFCSLACFGWAAISTGSATVRMVPAQYSKIQSAINASTHGDEIVVATGTYFETLYLGSKNITVRSTDPLDPETVAHTIVDARLQGSVVTFTSTASEACVVAGLTLTHGLAFEGGGIAGNGAHARISHCRIVDNTAIKYFPFIVTLYYGFGGAAADFAGTIEYCEVTRNRSEGNWSPGGGGAFFDCDGIIRNNVIRDNYSRALDFLGMRGSTIEQCDGLIEFNDIHDNVGYAALRNCLGRVQCNRIYNHAGPAISDCALSAGNLITNNGAVAEGVGNFWNNTACGNVVGVTATRGSVRNNILWNNGLTSLVSDTARVQFNCIQGWTGGGPGNIASDPRFEDAAQGKFQLLADSPCIDAAVWVDGATVDLDGRARPLDSGRGPLGDGSQLDMGAYESPLTFGPAPYRPANVSPIDATLTGRAVPHLVSSAFGSPDPAAQHGFSRWQVSADPAFITLAYDSGWRADDLLAHDVPAWYLLAYHTYYWRVSHRDQVHRAGPWSIPSRIDTLFYEEGMQVPADFPTIQAAIDAAPDGIQIVVARGVYHENLYMRGRNITLRSITPQNPAVVEETIVDGGWLGSVLRFAGDETSDCVVFGLTLRNGSYVKGGGVQGNGTHATLRNNRIINCIADVRDGYGGGAGLWGCDGLIEGNLIADNFTGTTLGDHGSGMGLWQCDGVIRGNVIRGNHSPATYYGGDALAFCNGRIEGNLITGHANPAIYQCDGEIVRNTIENNGPRTLHYCDGNIAGNLIRNNSGEAVFLCQGTIVNNVITGNGFAVMAESSSVWNFCNNTVYGNQWGVDAHAGSGFLRNNIIWGNGNYNLNANEETLGRMVVEFNAIEGWSGHGPTNLLADPRFVNAVAGDFHLAADSPYIDAGIVIAEATEDAEGRPRPFDSGRGPLADGSQCDLGAYESTLVVAEAPDTPVGLAPNNVTVADPILLVSSAFHSNAPGATHAASRWQVAMDAAFSQVVFDTRWEPDRLLSRAVPPAVLAGQHMYYWRVSHRDSSHRASPWCETAVFFFGDPGPSARLIRVPLHFATIQAALDAAVAGDTIIVATGTYHENLFMRGKNVSLSSQSPGDRAIRDQTIIDGSGKMSVITFGGTENETCVVEGLTLRNGVEYKVDDEDDMYGAAIRGQNCQATLAYNLVTGNTGESAIGDCHGLIHDNEVVYNHAGGIGRCHGAIQYNILAYNEVTGIWACDGRILRNDVHHCAYGITSANGEVNGNRIRWCGTGVSGSYECINNLLAFNDLGVRNTHHMQNCTVARNTRGVLGGNLRQMENCIVWDNVVEDLYGQDPSQLAIQYSCLPVGDGTGVIHADPQMIYPAGGVFRLKATSPCIDSGMRVDAATEDINGIPRPFIARPGGSHYDMGCFEWDEAVGPTSPLRPVNLSPATGAETSYTPTLIASAFQSPLPEYFHKDSEWQVDDASTFGAVVWDSDWDPVHKTQIAVPADTLRAGAIYYWRVRYRNQQRVVSEWSEPTQFRTPSAMVLHVPAEYPTIQAAIDACPPGATVEVAPGTYYENIRFRGADIAVQSQNPLDPAVVEQTIIDGSRSGPVVEFSGGELPAALLAGLTIAHGSSDDGGGVQGNLSQASIERCRIVDNIADTAGYPGGGNAGAILRHRGRIVSCLISQNHAMGYYSPKRNERSGGSGGAMYECSGLIAGNTIERNTCISGYVMWKCNGRIEGNLITNNVGDTVYCNSGGSVVRNRIFDNTGRALWITAGEAMGNVIGGVVSAAQTRFLANTVVVNAPTISYAMAANTCEVRNCIIWRNASVSTSALAVSKPEYLGAVEYDFIEKWNYSPATILVQEDPLLMDPWHGDFRLHPDSPCIDAGTALADVSVDVAATAVPQGDRFDIGALEYVDRPDLWPARPANVIPASGALHIPLGPMLTASAFASPVAGAAHADSWWQVSRVPDFSRLVYNQRWDSVHKTTLTLPSEILALNTTYYWRVSYRDQFGNAGHFSAPTTFYTGPVENVMRVPRDWPTIQSAIDAAGDGAEIVVSPGRYIENTNMKGKNVTLRSTDPTDPAIVASTILDGSHYGSVVTFAGTENESCLLSGFTITNGFYSRGGGINGNSCHVTIAYNVVENNLTSGTPPPIPIPGWGTSAAGGGIASCDGLIHHNVIRNNGSDGKGGGMSSCDGVIQQNRIEGNWAVGGGGLANCYGTVVDNDIVRNVSTQTTPLGGGGGGLYYCSGLVENNRILENVSGYWGGGLAYCSGIILHNRVESNRIQNSGQTPGEGGGFYHCDGDIVGNLIVRNAAGDGGALYRCNGRIVNNTIAGNSSQDVERCAGSITNCIIGSMYYYESSIPQYCLLQSYEHPESLGPDSRIGAPRFVNVAAGDYHLRPDSPAINAGTPMALATTDLDGRALPLESVWDMGAYEFDPAEWDGRPVAPQNLLPPSGATQLALEITLTASPFLPPTSSATHGASRWQLSKRADFSQLRLDTGADSEHLTSLGLSSSVLGYNTTYYWRVSYLTNRGVASPWSSPTSFSTAPTVAIQVPVDYATIQAAIDAASMGTEIIVSPGIYRENIYMRGKELLLRSTDPGGPAVVASTIIDGSRLGPVVAFAGTEDESGVLAGFTIRSGFTYNGAGIAGNRCRAQILSNVIEDNIVSGYNSPSTVYRCDGIIEGNTVRHNGQEGALYASTLNDCDGVIRGNTIEANLAIAIAYADGLIEHNLIADNLESGLLGCHAVIEYNQIVRNVSKDRCGGLAYCGGTLQYNLIADNTGPVGGGVFDFEGTIAYNRILRNKGSDGGGISVVETGSIVGNLIEGNRGTRGGGLHFCNVPCYNNTIVKNVASDIGAAAFNCTAPDWANNIFWGNVSSRSPMHFGATLNYCLIQDGAYSVGIGCITGDPQFVDAAHGDYRLLPSSPCVNAGSSIASVTADLDNVSRPVGAGWDIGAYECLNPPPATPTPTPGPAAAYDLNSDGMVDGLDLMMLLEHYHTAQKPMDLDQSGRIDCMDLMMFSRHWRTPSH